MCVRAIGVYVETVQSSSGPMLRRLNLNHAHAIALHPNPHVIMRLALDVGVAESVVRNNTRPRVCSGACVRSRIRVRARITQQTHAKHTQNALDARTRS